MPLEPAEEDLLRVCCLRSGALAGTYSDYRFISEWIAKFLTIFLHTESVAARGDQTSSSKKATVKAALAREESFASVKSTPDCP